METEGQHKTALGVAKARFTEALPRKAKELEAAVARLRESPDVTRLREEMRRRLHALYASAQVFREEALASAVKAAIEKLDRARDSQRSLSPEDLDALTSLASELPSLGAGQSGEPAAPQASAQPMAAKGSASVAAKAAPAGDSAERKEVEGKGRELPDNQTLVSVLVLDDAETSAQIRDFLPAERFEVLATADPEEALKLARSSAPDLVLAEHTIALNPQVDFIARLRGDPLTDLVPVFLLMPAGSEPDAAKIRAAGAEQVISKPLDGWALLRAVGNLLLGPGKLNGALETLSEATVDEVAERVAQEIRQGLTEALQAGKDRKIPLGEGHEILAATWATIGRIRAHLSYRSKGSVRFRDVPRRGGPAVLALVDEDSYAGDESLASGLEGRRILVVDDDPSVRWFFAKLLKEAGAALLEAGDGKEALEMARRDRPDLLISDILMPEIDGFALCRELKRDVMLSDVPVILISWKEDLLQRMRELQSGASGYLRKEAGGARILERIRQVLKPRARLEALLRTGGEVRGRIEGLGVLTLLQTAARERRNARLTVRDARSLFEVDLRDGELVALTKTATDGTFARGTAALEQLLGARSGRFAVVQSNTPVRPIFHDPLPRLLQKSANRLAALLDSVSDSHLAGVGRVVFNEDALPSALGPAHKPSRNMEIVERLRRGESPRDMLVDEKVAPHELEACLDDMARLGAIAQVLSPGGEDRVAEALRLREEKPGTLIQATAGGVAAVASEEDAFWQEVERDSSAPRAPAPEAEQKAATSDSVAEALRRLNQQTSAEGSPPAVAATEPAVSEEPAASSAPAASEAADIDLAAAPAASASEAAPGGGTSSVRPAAVPPPAPPEAARVTAQEPRPGRSTTASPASPGRFEFDSTPGLAARRSSEAPGMIEQALRQQLAVEPPAPARGAGTPAAGRPPARVGLPSKPPPRPVVASEPPQSQSSGLGLIFLLAVMVAVGYFGFKSLSMYGAGKMLDRWRGGFVTSPAPNLQPPGTGATGTQIQAKSAFAPAAPAENAPAQPRIEEEPSLGRTLPFIDQSWGIQVSEDQGLLAVEWKGEGPAPEVRVDERKLGRAPLAAALSPGRHELLFNREGESSFRYVVVRSGQTRIVQAPE